MSTEFDVSPPGTPRYLKPLAIAGAVGVWVVVTVRAYNDDAEYRLPADDVEKIEEQRYRALASSAQAPSANERAFSHQPLPGTLT